jgi:uncharacterized membrane protein YhhN
MIFSTRKDYRLAAVSAFFFSWVGDVFLMVAHLNELLFFAGVGGFFIAQVLYIRLFLKFSGDGVKRGFIYSKPIWAIPVLLYLAIILIILIKNMEGVMIPVIVVYAISLIGMLLAALNRRGRVNRCSFRYLFIGSLLFVLSDSMIAINKFVVEFPKSSFLIMLTYFIAQYMIMQGLLRDNGTEVQ